MTLEDLIDIAIIDGNITDKEREVIRNKAQKEGFDPDEAEMILDAKLQKMKIEHHESTSKIRKCPNCGEPITAGSLVCPTCGFEFQKVNANSSFTDLSTKLLKAEKERRVYSDDYDKTENEAKRIANLKKSIINTFPIPNTKDDLLEFITMANGLTEKKGSFLRTKTAKIVIIFILSVIGAIIYTACTDDKGDKYSKMMFCILCCPTIFTAIPIIAICKNDLDIMENNILASAWKAKIKQCMAKAQIMIDDPKELEKLKNIVRNK